MNFYNGTRTHQGRKEQPFRIYFRLFSFLSDASRRQPEISIFYHKICTIIKPLNKTITTEGYINFQSDMLKLNPEVLIRYKNDLNQNRQHSTISIWYRYLPATCTYKRVGRYLQSEELVGLEAANRLILEIFQRVDVVILPDLLHSLLGGPDVNGGTFVEGVPYRLPMSVVSK